MSSEALNAKVTVWFKEPVRGVDQDTGDDFVANRHVLRASQLIQDVAMTSFVDQNGELVGEWETSLIDHLKWEKLEVEAHVGSVEWRKKMQGRYPMAYEPWTSKEDEQLRQEDERGLGISQMSTAHRRGDGAIRSRLRRLGLRD